MRSAKTSELKYFLQKGVPTTPEIESTNGYDGGALLWCCDWKENCFKKYVQIMLISYTNLRSILLCLMDILFQQKTQIAKNVQEGFQIQLTLRTYIRAQQMETHFFKITQTRKPLLSFWTQNLRCWTLLSDHLFR